MGRCVEFINPSPIFMTAADFEDQLREIDNSLNPCDKKTLSFADKKQELEKIYSKAIALARCCGGKLDKQLSFLLADLFRQYGSLCFNEDFIASKQLFLASLHLHLYAIDFVDNRFDITDYCSLEDLAKQGVNQPELFGLTEQRILTMDIPHCIARAEADTLAQPNPQKRMIQLAETVNWLCFCCQNIEKYTAPEPNNDLRFRQLFEWSEMLLLLVDTEESTKLLGELYYHALPFLQQREHPEDWETACRLYNKALACDNSKEMQAKVANMRSMILVKAKQFQEANRYLQDALTLSEQLEDTDQNNFSKAFIHHNLAAYYMEPEPAIIDVDKAEFHLLKAKEYASKLRAHGEERLEFVLYDLRLAELKLILGDFVFAKKAIDLAVEKLEKYINSRPSLVCTAKAWQSIIDKTNRLRDLALTR